MGFGPGVRRQLTRFAIRAFNGARLTLFAPKDSGERSNSDAIPVIRIGGEPALAAFVERFSEAMARDPEVARIWSWHPADIRELKAKLAAFLSGFAGGPPLYPQRYGPPFMRARHLPFPIGTQERDMWLKCARVALAETIGNAQSRAEFGAKLAAFADHTRNREANEGRVGAPRGAAGGET